MSDLQPSKNEKTPEPSRPHYDKLVAALQNPKAKGDESVLQEALSAYKRWAQDLESLTSRGRERVNEMVDRLNRYKDFLEVDLILGKGSPFLTRQKGQLKLDNSVFEEFLVHLVRPEIIDGLPASLPYVTGPHTAFMSLAFNPISFTDLFKRPDVVVKSKDQDFILGANVNYAFSAPSDPKGEQAARGTFAVAALAAECKINLDKTMFQEAAGTAARLKQGCPFARYFVVVEYLDMTPEDVRLTAIDNVFLVRKAKRLPFEKRTDIDAVRAQRKESPISADIIWKIAEEIQRTVSAVWYDPSEVLKRGSFI